MKLSPIGVVVRTELEGAIPVYETAGGIEVFEIDSPYLLDDGRSLVDPIPVRVVDGAAALDLTGALHPSLPVTGLGPPPDPEPPINGVTHNGVLVTHNGEIVTHGGA